MAHIYFAYGSNLDPHQMRKRCPDSRLIERATLQGFRLAFTGHSRNRNGAVATVLPSCNHQVLGLLWTLSDADLKRLDRCEGYPRVYTRETHKVQLMSGAEDTALVYIKEDKTPAAPHEDYFNIIKKAYEQQGFNLEHLELALDISN